MGQGKRQVSNQGSKGLKVSVTYSQDTQLDAPNAVQRHPMHLEVALQKKVRLCVLLGGL